jgi:hypothetical protein
VRVTPSASLGRLEEVLVITKVTEKEADTTGLGPIRASDILAQRLPSVPDKPAGTTPNSAPGGTSQAASSTAATAPAANTPGAAAAPGNGAAAKPKTTQPRPAKSTVETAKPAAGGEATP